MSTAPEKVGDVTMDGLIVGSIILTRGTLFPLAPDERADPTPTEQQIGEPGERARHHDDAPEQRRHRDHAHTDNDRHQAPRQRFGGEGDTDPLPPRTVGRDVPVSARPVDGDRVYGRFAEARDRARAELAAKPWLRDKVLRIAANEQGQHPLGTQGVLETMMNRAAVRGTDVETQAKWHGGESGGYYAMGSMGRGALENPHSRAILNESLERVLGGSNITSNATDNSSSTLAAREKATGSFRHHLDVNGESFFSPGSAEPVLRDRWARLNYEAFAMKAAAQHEAETAAAEKLAAGEIKP